MFLENHRAPESALNQSGSAEGRWTLLEPVLLSLAIHAAALVWVPAVSPGGGAAPQVLQLEFRRVDTVTAVGPAHVSPNLPPNPVKIEVPSGASVAATEARTRSLRTSATVALPAPETTGPTADDSPSAPVAPTGADAAPAATSKPGEQGVVVVMMVAPDGRVGDIYWNQLPALTDVQLRVLETLIRERVYPPDLELLGPRRMTELVDVRTLLKLPSVR